MVFVTEGHAHRGVVHDSPELEKKCIPTVTMCTDAFVSLARAVVTAKEIPSLRTVVTPHSIAGIPAEQVRAKADKAVDEIVQCLAGM